MAGGLLTYLLVSMGFAGPKRSLLMRFNWRPHVMLLRIVWAAGLPVTRQIMGFKTRAADIFLGVFLGSFFNLESFVLANFLQLILIILGNVFFWTDVFSVLFLRLFFAYHYRELSNFGAKITDNFPNLHL